MWKRIRKWLWKRGLRYPAQPGWEALVHEVASTDLWQRDGLVGLPLEWTLLERNVQQRVIPVQETCHWSGLLVSGGTPVVEGPEGPVHNLSAWGVRCSRCGVPIHCEYAGMRYGNDVPSCPPCRSAVTTVKKGERS